MILSRRFLLALTFWGGVLTLAIEVFAFRSMALVASGSILITSIVIAIVIISLSLGYYFSIRVRKQNYLKTILRSLICICFLLPCMALVAPLATYFIGPFVYSGSHMLSILFVSLLVLPILSVPLPFFLGFISPLLFSCLRQYYTSDQETAARSFIASGLGSLFGSIVPNLLLIPLIGMVHSYLLLALMTMGFLFCFPTSLAKRLVSLATLFAVFVAVSLLHNSLFYRNYLAKTETPYQNIYVWETNNVRTLAVNAQIGNQSYYDPDMILRRRSFFDNTLLFLLHDYPEHKNVLMLGSAGATISTIANQFFAEHIDFTFTNVDIDPAMHDIAKKWFNAENENVQFVNADARAFVQFDSDTYDLVIIDTYTNELFIPFSLLTVEFFRSLRARMNINAIVTMNINAKNENSPIIQAAMGTLGKVFPYVYVTTHINGNTQFGPILVSASRVPLDFAAMATVNPVPLLGFEFGKMPGLTQQVNTKTLPYIVDDKAMAEYLSVATLLATN